MKRPKPLVLAILDGWGVATDSPANAITAADTPNFDEWLKQYPNTLLETSGRAVGLPKGQMGNSEVGHLNIGAGRIVAQELTRITTAIENGSFINNPVLVQAMDSALKQNKNVHFLGLLSDGGVHSHIDHIFALLGLAKQNGINPLLHVFLDGRDVAPRSALNYVEKLENKIKDVRCGTIATVCGRYYAMDRDNRWDRIQKAYNAMVNRIGFEAKSAKEAVQKAYERGENDEFVKPTRVWSQGSGLQSETRPQDLTPGINENDSVIFFNFRPDRAREITRAFIIPDFDAFDRGARPPHVFFVSMTQYDETFDIPVAFPPSRPSNILADILAENGLKQLRIAETEKYAHVTFFFNGGEEIKRANEERILIPSPKVATYDLQPQMSANEVTDELLKQLQTDKFDVIILNFANPDMVGHTGIFKAAVKAIETIDANLGRIIKTVKSKEGITLITADHGNAEKMSDLATDKPYTAHTTSKVPFLLIDNGGLSKVKLRNAGVLADIAPTILDILGVDKPKEMTGKSLIANIKNKIENRKNTTQK